MNLIIHNVTVFTNDDQNTVLENQAVAVKGARIEAVGTPAALKKKYKGFRQFDGEGRLLMPGLINAHMHFYGTFARGLSLPKPPRNFHEILRFLWWRLDTSLDLDAVYYSALVPAIGAVKHGVTAVIDHHASPNAVDGSLDRIEEALAQVGLRAVLCYEVSDRNGEEVRFRGLAENDRYIRKCQAAKEQNPDHLFDGMIGLHASFTLDEETLDEAAALSRSLDRGCHIHLLEDMVDARLTEQKYGADVVERLLQYGILGPQSIAAHGIHLDQVQMDALAYSDTMIVHNPQSNMNNAVGRADIFGLLKRGLPVGLGTDGMSPDVRPDLRTGYLLHKLALRNPNLGWEEFQKILLKNNPLIYRRVTGQPVGRIEPGYLADLILVDYFPPTPLTGENFWGHFLFGIVDAPVDTTIINGEIVMEHGQLPQVDEAAVAAEARKVAAKVWERFYA
ncbi:MAG: putative aminohydrolase SsnA [Calditrichaeota bacterium]|nr:MAG: putative aminohydrolase SsnA [Calditrichota bacterium]